MIGKTVYFLFGLLPLTAGAFGFINGNDQTYPGPDGRYGIYQSIRISSTLPDPVVTTHVCSGAAAILVPALNYEIEDPKMTGLRQLWALSNYRTNPLPAVWRPDKTPPTTQEVGAFQRFTPETDGRSILKFIARFGLPSRYLIGQWDKEQVAAMTHHMPVHDETQSLQGPDFLIYDLPSGHAVALYVPKPPANEFITAVIIDSKGDLLWPKIVKPLLQSLSRQLIPPRKITADSDGAVTALDTNGRKQFVGTWTARDHQLVITTIEKNEDAFAPGETVWFTGVQYALDIYVNDHEVICDPMYDPSGAPGTTNKR